MLRQLGALAICAVVLFCIFLRRRRRLSSIRDIPGPPNPSWIFGHQWYLLTEEAGGSEKRFLEDFGNVVRWKGPFGEDCLWLADPKALNHILHKSGYLYAKPSNINEVIVLLADRGVASVGGDVHKRHRRAMSPAFGLVEAKGLLPYFMESVTKMADKWSSILGNSKSGDSAIIDVNMWLGQAALDAIGAGAFDYDFGALDETDNPLTKSYTDIIFTTFGNPSRLLIFFMSITRFFPGLLTWLYDNSSHPGMLKLRRNKDEAHRVAQKLLDSKRQELKDGTPKRDVMSLLVKASLSQREDWRLTDEEIISQVRTIMTAGHETTSKAITLALWELAKHQDVQERLRTEINETLAKVRARGDADFTANDFESMPYLVAFIKESLRIHSIAPEISRQSTQDDVLPLTKPIVGTSGKVYTELPIPKGTIIAIPTSGYNLNQDVWGPDAYVFRPERWFEMNEQVESPVGVYGNLVSFSGGVKSCIGWRFAIVEMQAFIVTLVRKFDISPADHHPQIKRIKTGAFTPLVLGEEYKGPQLPLRITAVRNA